MPRFYCPPPLPSGGSFDLPSEAAHHAVRVLRLREGDRVEMFDGLGNGCRGVIGAIDGRRVIVDQVGTTDLDRESPLRILLAQAMVSSEKMDWVIQKATELGVAEIQPLDIMAWLQQMKEAPGAKLILLPQGAASLHAQQKPEGRAVLLIGAEGGFTEAESEAALHCGFTPVRLGARVLRTETAAVAGLAALQTLWGDFNV